MSVTMHDRRKPVIETTPRYEDSGIFKTQLVQLTVELVPLFAQNKRGDVLIKGFVDVDGAIDVVFAGRRKSQVKPLTARLQTLLNRTRAAGGTGGGGLDIDRIRHPVRIEGAWRPRFSCDDQGWQTREHQLYAARWLVMDRDGQAVEFGESPIR